MMNCRYCSNYHLNSRERVDDCCLGKNDCRREYFSCNENLNPNKTAAEKCSDSELITELKKRGYNVK